MPYLILKTLHILGVIVWMGGMTTILLLYARLGAKRQPGALRQVLDVAAEFGQRVVGPAAGITLIAGIALIIMYDIGLPVWVWWGIAGMTASMSLGGGAIRRATLRLVATLDAGGDYEAELRGLMRLAVINLLILASTVAAMVIKPG